MNGTQAPIAIYRGIDRAAPLRALLKRRRALHPAAQVPPRAALIWRERPDLQAVFDLSRRKGREGLASWYLRHAYGELGLRYDGGDDRFAALAARPMERMAQRAFAPITWLMRLFHDRCPQRTGPGLGNAPAQETLLNWFYAQGLMEANLAGFLTKGEAEMLRAPVTPGAAPRLLHCIWAVAPDLATRFSGAEDPAFRAWCEGAEGDDVGARRFPILCHPRIALAPVPRRRPLTERPFGVNLFGHANARSGVSEDVRMAVKVLEAAGIPFIVRNISPGATMPEEDGEAGEDPTSAALPYAINLFCMPAATTPEAAIKVGRHIIADYYNIGFWPWELPEVPRFWHHAYDFVDEVWASTQFTYAAFCRSSPVPVRHMPFAVVAEESAGRTRADFDLPEGPFLFGFAFDGLSGFARKAPLLALRAFQQAFPRDGAESLGEDRVGLVIKGMRAKDDPAWRQLRDEIAGDPRIHLVTDSLARADLLDLWRGLDAFVSLHRSEGFGRILAEMMLLERPVVTTAHSGNMDFTRHDTAALVPCTLRAVAPGEYPFGTGQLWAEADVPAAARQMRRLFEDRSWRETLSQAGRATILSHYAPQVVAARWTARLGTIYGTNEPRN